MFFFSDISEEILGVEHVENWGGELDKHWDNIGNMFFFFDKWSSNSAKT